MKKLIILALCFCALKANSQIVDTTVKNSVAVKIQPVISQHDFPVIKDTITHLGVFEYTATDTSCKVSYTLLHHAPTKNIVYGWHSLTESELAAWDGSLYGLLPILASRFGLTFKNN